MVRWHWIHGSCFLQCFMPIATAALQMRVNIAGEPSTLGRALSHGLNIKLRPAGWHRLKGHTVRFFFLPPSLLFRPLLPISCVFLPHWVFSSKLDKGEMCIFLSRAHQCGFSFKWETNEKIKLDGCLVVARTTLCWRWNSHVSLMLMFHTNWFIYPSFIYSFLYLRLLPNIKYLSSIFIVRRARGKSLVGRPWIRNVLSDSCRTSVSEVRRNGLSSLIRKKGGRVSGRILLLHL